MTVAEMEGYFATYLEGLSNRSVIPSEDSGPQPSSPYLTYRTFSINPLVYDLETYSESNGQCSSNMRGLSLVQFNVDAIGGEAFSVLKRIKNSFYSTYFLDKLGAQEFGGFGFSQATEVIDISATLIDSEFESRAQFTVDFYIPLSESYDIDHYDRASITVIEEEKNYNKTVIIPEQN